MPVVTPPAGGALDSDALARSCHREMPRYITPQPIERRVWLPSRANGKIGPKRLAGELAGQFQ